ncbi:Acetyl-CoA carboxylase [Sarcoptes scabiei]|nr:Acetyl-CoA carboxylase [Sarcoptes scabiei]
MVKAMHRCDIDCKRLSTISDNPKSDLKPSLEKELKSREQMLMSCYHQVALSFADLHDTPVRMYEKNCITEVVPWRNSRQYFYWVLKRRLCENRVKNEIQRVILNKNDAEASSMIRRWFVEHTGQHNQHQWEDNKIVAEWLESQLISPSSQVLDNIRCIQRDALARQIQSLYEDFPSATFDSLVQLIHSGMTQQQRSSLLSALVSLESDAENITNANSNQTVCDSGATSDCGTIDSTATENSSSSIKNETTVGNSSNNE